MRPTKGRKAIATTAQSIARAAQYIVRNDTRGQVLAGQAGIAATFVRRGIGLMFRKSLPESGGLVIKPCNGVVCFFMRFPIDVLFLDNNLTAVYQVHSMRPWRVSKIVRGSKLVVELPAGTLQRSGSLLGDRISIEPATT